MHLTPFHGSNCRSRSKSWPAYEMLWVNSHSKVTKIYSCDFGLSGTTTDIATSGNAVCVGKFENDAAAL